MAAASPISDSKLSVLLVEDNADDASLLREMFRKERPGAFELIHAKSMNEAVERIQKSGIDVVLLDLGLPDSQGLDPIRRVHAAAPNTPVIVLTGLDDENLAAEAMKEGALDYLIKGQVENRALPRALRSAIERHRLQDETEQVRQSQMQLKDEFLSHVSHELRSPLTAIHQFVTILRDGLAGEMPSEQMNHMNVIFRNVNQLQAMINDLLEVTRIQEGKLTLETQRVSTVDAVTYAINTLQRAAAAKNVTLVSDIPDSLPPAYADPARLRQILIILVDNAIKFSYPGGKVRIKLEMTEGADSLQLEVSDSGCGLDPEAATHVFDRLYQVTNPDAAGRQGLGLGLYIGRKLITSQGGDVWVRSEPGKGSKFIFTVPILSIAKVIAPLFDDCGAANAVSLVVVEAVSRKGLMTNDLRLEYSREIRCLLKQCIHPALDVILPNMGESVSAIVHVVARAPESGVEVLVQRISNQLARLESIDRHGVSFTVTHRQVKLGSTERKPETSVIAFVAGKFEGMIRLDDQERTIQNGQEEDSHYR